jgi:cyanate lyase
MGNTALTGRSNSHKGLEYQDYLKKEFLNFKESKSDAVKNLLKYLKLTKNEIIKVESYTDVGCLPSGGDPKTDVVVKVFNLKGGVRQLNISAKQSSCPYVSFHEYPASAFIEVLNLTDKKAISIIQKHQTDGSAKNILPADKKHLELILRPKLEILWGWVICGLYHSGKGDQIANTVVCNDKFYSYSDYKNFLSLSTRGFGTGFSWTRQSRGKEKTIQLKGPVLSYYQK